MSECNSCGSANLIRGGGNYTTRTGTIKQRFKCADCGKHQSINAEVNEVITPSKQALKSILITSAKNNTDTHRGFYNTLLSYAEKNDCDFYVLPTRHKNLGEEYVPEFDNLIQDRLLQTSLEIPEYKLKIFGNLKLSASLENPLSGLDSMSKGHSLVVGHPQVQLRTLPRIHETYPPILTTTGSISVKSYKDTKPGVKANFNHSYSALVIEFDEVNGNKFVHMRHLNYDEQNDGFYDLDTLYRSNGEVEVLPDAALALVTGDEHAIFADPVIEQTTYLDPNSLVNTLKPAIIVRHDVLDAHSISHHHKQDFIKRYQKRKDGSDSLQKELDITVDYLNRTTSSEVTSFIVQSNHNEHLYRWLNECDPKKEPWNAKLYHKIMFQVLDKIDNGETGVDPFALYCEGLLSKNIRFVGRTERFQLLGIWLGSHGDVGNNGSRGSRQQFSEIPSKSIIGHSHSPGIEKGCYQVGTSSNLRLDYNVGASNWHHCHCVVHNNGKRQLIFITHGKFRK